MAVAAEFPPLPEEANETQCRGCRENQPNQQAHMDVGGCMYEPEMTEQEAAVRL